MILGAAFPDSQPQVAASPLHLCLAELESLVFMPSPLLS